MSDDTPDEPEKKGPSRRDLLRFGAEAVVTTNIFSSDTPKAPNAIHCTIEENKEKNMLAEREEENVRHYIINATPEYHLSAIQFRNMLATHVPDASALGRMGKTKIETVAYTKEKDGEPEIFQHELRIATSDAEVRTHLDKCCASGTIDLPTLRQSIDCTPTPRGRG